MEQYLQRTQFSTLMDTVGKHLLMLGLGLGWFILQWGVRLPALTAGLALYGMLLLLRRATQDKRLKQREQRLRARIGGEMTLERLLLEPPNHAHFEVVMLLSQKYPLTLLRATDEGVLCSYHRDTLLVSFLQRPGKEQVSAQDVLGAQRAVRAHNATRAVLCVPCGISANAQSQANAQPPVHIMPRSMLIALAGAASPVTDQQLVALGQRRRARIPAGVWLRHIVTPARAPRYALYGVLLLGMYLITRLPYYPIPALICIVLWVACRCVPEADSKL